jgi:hypothetical protein
MNTETPKPVNEKSSRRWLRRLVRPQTSHRLSRLIKIHRYRYGRKISEGLESLNLRFQLFYFPLEKFYLRLVIFYLSLRIFCIQFFIHCEPFDECWPNEKS